MVSTNEKSSVRRINIEFNDGNKEDIELEDKNKKTEEENIFVEDDNYEQDYPKHDYRVEYRSAKTEAHQMRIQLEKAEAQMKIAGWALAAMICAMAFLLSPWAPVESKITALDAPLSTFFVATASIVGAYMGFAAWMSRK